jgi:hypothetical protein
MSTPIKTSLNLDELYKKLNKTSNLNDVRLKRQISIDKQRYEQGLALENIQLANKILPPIIDTEIKFDFSNIQVESVNDTAIKNELESMLFNSIPEIDDDVEIIEIVDKKKVINEIILSDDSAASDDDDEDDDVIILEKEDYAEELRNKLTKLSINRIIKVEETFEMKEEKHDFVDQPTTTTTIMFDSVLGTISGHNDTFINELAQKLATNLNLPFEFMTLDEFNRYKESQDVKMTSEDT